MLIGPTSWEPTDTVASIDAASFDHCVGPDAIAGIRRLFGFTDSRLPVPLWKFPVRLK